MSRRGAPAPERFWQKVAVVNGCWLWTARKNNKGYGVFNPEWNVRVYAHRWSYEQTNGPIPGGLEIDHLCRAPACVNPEHLEAVSHRENIMRSNAPTALNAQKTHCSNGHPFDSENTYIRANGGRCRTCNSERSARRQHAVRRAAATLGISVSDYIDLHGESMRKALQFAGVETQHNNRKENTTP
jgi:hypothetical protein